MRLAIRLAIVLAAAVLAAACTADDPAPAPGAVVTEAPPLDPIEIGEDPVWTEPGGELFRDAYKVTLHDDTAILFGLAPDLTMRLAAVSLPDGQVRWQLDQGAALPGAPGLVLAGPSRVAPRVSGRGADWVVPVAYSTGGSAEGLAALSGLDGTVRWSAPMTDVPGAYGKELIPEVTNEDVVVAIAVGTATLDKRPLDYASDPVPVAAFSSSDGTRRWHRDELAPTGIAGDVLVGSDGSDALGVDLSTGETRWELPNSEPSLVSGDLALLRRSGAVLLDARTGEDTGVDLEGVAPELCQADDTMIACVATYYAGHAWLVTYQPARRRVEAAELERSGFNLTAVVWGRLFFARVEGPPKVLDIAGNRLTERWPAVPVAHSEHYAAFNKDGIRIHALH